MTNFYKLFSKYHIYEFIKPYLYIKDNLIFYSYCCTKCNRTRNCIANEAYFTFNNNCYFCRNILHKKELNKFYKYPDKGLERYKIKILLKLNKYPKNIQWMIIERFKDKYQIKD